MKRFFFENLGLKLLALLIAVGLWAYVGSRQVYMERRIIRLEFRDIPAGVTPDPKVETTVPVVLTGRTESFRELDRDDLKAVVSLRSFRPGDKEMTLQPKVLPLPPGIKVEVPDLKVPLLALKASKERKKK